MNFLKVIESVVGELETSGVRYALIGGFAMGLRGVQRATMDLDFILMMEDMEKADAILNRFGYSRAFRSDNVSHYVSNDEEWGRIDILHAFRGPSLRMLERADPVSVDERLRLRVVQIEDLIGLKIQAVVNDPSRAEDDWHDVRTLLKAAGNDGRRIDWDLIADYLDLFHLKEKLPELKAIHGQAD